MIPDLYLAIGWRGYGKSQYIYDNADHSKSIMALDPRGDLYKKSKGKYRLICSRLELMEEIREPNFKIFYQPGHEEYSDEEDVEFWLTRARACHGITILVDESAYYFDSSSWPEDFEKLVADSRTQKNVIMVSAHRITEIPVKLRSLGKFVCFRITNRADLNELGAYADLETIEKIRTFEQYQFVILPED